MWPSPITRELFARLARIAASDAAVLIQGDSAAGNELVARTIHQASPRAGAPFGIIDCTALPGSLASALEAAEGGSVFLDEIGAVPPGLQPRLLRVLDARVVQRPGEIEPRPVNVRFISATARDLPALVGSGHFRAELYFRLAVLPVKVPALGARAPDGEGERLGLPEALLDLPYKQARERALGQIERAYLRGLLARHNRNISAAAEAAGLNRGYLHRLVRKHDL